MIVLMSCADSKDMLSRFAAYVTLLSMMFNRHNLSNHNIIIV